MPPLSSLWLNCISQIFKLTENKSFLEYITTAVRGKMDIVIICMICILWKMIFKDGY